MKHLLSIIKSATVILALGILLSLWVPAMAEQNRGAGAKHVVSTSSPQPGPTDPAEMETFLDGLLAKQMADYHIAGAAVAVVKDGKLFFAKGYGYSNVEGKVPVDPETTIFRIGSVGKVFTWTAVMQLVEQGKLDLNADINTYLDFKIPDTYPQPITLKHLMTHTSGFEDRHFGSAVTDAKDLVPAREWLVSHIWARVRPPGVAGYSNYNAILAGYIVARVSGQPYDQYIQEHIFKPLGMAHSTAQSPIPPELQPLASVGYIYGGGGFQALPDYVGQPAGMPSGGHLASVTDMARFMIARLQGGRYSDAVLPEARILKDTTAQQMLSTLYTPDPRVLGTAYGLFDWSENGQRALGHTGYLPPMHSLLLLLPDQNLGVFVSYNSSGGGAVNGQHAGFQKAFLDHYYPAPAVAPVQPPADFSARAARFVGTYNAYSSYTTLLKVLGLFGAGYTTQISDPGDGTLLMTLEGQKLRFAEVEPLYFRQVDGPFSIVFHEDDQGRITYMSPDLMPQYAVKKLDWYETPGFNMPLALGCILLFLSTIPVVLIRAIWNRVRGGPSPAVRGANAAFWILLGISLANLLVMVVLAWGATGGIANELLDLPLIMKILLGMGMVAAVLTVGALVYTVLAWKDGYWGIISRVYYTAVTIAAVAFVWFLNNWNLLGLRF